MGPSVTSRRHRSHKHLCTRRTLWIVVPNLSVLSVTICILSVKSVAVRITGTGDPRPKNCQKSGTDETSVMGSNAT